MSRIADDVTTTAASRRLVKYDPGSIPKQFVPVGTVARTAATLIGLAAANWLAGCASADVPHRDAPPGRETVAVPMRDGVRLATNVFLPSADGKYPVVLERSAYGKSRKGDYWTNHGYAFVSQDVRGQGDSGGSWYPFFQEKNDGHDTLEWIHRQPWCNGKVGMAGPSYLGAVQYLAVLGGAGHLLTTIIPTFMTGDLWHRAYYTDGVLTLFLTFDWTCFDAGEHTRAAVTREELEELYRGLPIRSLDEHAGLEPVKSWRDFIEHDTHDDYWQATSIRKRYDLFDMPVLQIAGWYDYYAKEAFDIYNELVRSAENETLAKSHKVLIGPWGHHYDFERAGLPPGHVFAEYGEHARYEAYDRYREWFDRALKGEGPTIDNGAPIRLFVMGSNQWRDEYEWPLARTRYVSYYLRSGGSANSLHGDGTLSTLPPEGDEPFDRYVYDPEHPVPTVGGNHSNKPWSRNPAVVDLIWAGPSDQRPVEQREDVLVYTTAPLERDVEVTGPIRLELWASSSAPDTDFIGRLVDVHPDGRAIHLTEGIVRARYRNRDWSTPEFLEPGRPYKFTVDLQVTSNTFRAGHRIRLDITSSNFPLWARNLNTDEDPYAGTRIEKATQTIYHDRTRPSRLVLPVIP